MKVRSFTIIFPIITALFVVFFTGPMCNAATGRPEIRVGIEQDFGPYSFVDDKAQPAGFGVDLIRAVADVMDIPVSLSASRWDTAWNDLVAGKIDVLPVVAKAPSRVALVNFSLPHTETFDAFFVRDSYPSIQNIEAARGKKIVVLRSDAAHHELQARNFREELVLVDSIPEGLSLISSGKYDAFLSSKLVGTMAIKEQGIKGVKAGPIIPDYKRVFSFAVKKGDDELLEKLNQGLMMVKISGEYDRIYEKWLHIDGPWRKYEKYLFPVIAVVIVIVVIAGFWLLMLQKMVRKRTRELAEINEMLSMAKKDLDERIVQRTAELVKSEARYRSYIEVTGQIGWTTDADGMVVEDLPSWRKYTGQTFDKIKGWGWSNALHPDDLASTAKVWSQSVVSRSAYEAEYRIRRFDGVYRHFLARGIPVFREDGTILEWVGTCIDITERKTMEEELRKYTGELNELVAQQTAELKMVNKTLVTEISERKRSEEALRSSEERYRRLVENSPDILYSFSDKRGGIYYSARAEKILGYPLKELYENPLLWNLSIHPDDREKIGKVIKAFAEGNDFDVEYRIMDKYGKWLWFHDRSINIRTEGAETIIDGIARDVTRQKEMEEEKKKLESQLLRAQRMESIGTLAAGIAHDFNNILTPIMMNSTAAMMDLNVNSPVRRYLERILMSATRAKGLVEQILTFSRKGEYNLKILKLQDILSETLKLLRASIPSTIEIRQKIDPCGPVLADSTQMHQVVMNLCTNAYQAMRESGGLMEIALDEMDVDVKFARRNMNLRPGRYVRFTVRDTGHGMDEATMERIFDPFFTTKGTGGTGLGLSLVQGIIIGHGGDIEVQSKPGKGTTFYIYLPRAADDVKLPELKKEEVVLPGKEAVLFVDDEADIVAMAKEMLDRLGYAVTAKTDSLEALEEFRANPGKYDLILTDYTMPKMDGLELAREMKNIHPGIPIIIASGFNEAVASEKFRTSGISFTIMKPYAVNDLAKAIRSVIDHKKTGSDVMN